jgi:MoxR-like ATPase
MNTRVINTNLLKKEEVFRILALAEATGLAMLLIGPPGVAKTASVIDYAKAAGNGTLANDELFILETDEGTKSTAVKGNIDLEELTLNQKYKVISPITKAKFVVINEVDKASASLRNSLLGVMNEKVLFNGKDAVPCDWNVFVATCNKIPEDEIGSPFWDRFMITFEVERVRQSDIMDYYAKGAKSFKKANSINLPDAADIAAITLTPAKLGKVVDLAYAKLSDRTLSYLPTLVKNIMVVYQVAENGALIKAVELLIGKAEANVLAKSLVPQELRLIYDKIDLLAAASDYNEYSRITDEINLMTVDLINKNKLADVDKADIQVRYEQAQDKLEFLIEDDNISDEDEF